MSARNEGRGRRRNRRDRDDLEEGRFYKSKHRSKRSFREDPSWERPHSYQERRRKRRFFSTSRRRTRSYDESDDLYYSNENYRHHRGSTQHRRKETSRKHRSRKRSRQEQPPQRSPSVSSASSFSSYSGNRRRHNHSRRRKRRRSKSSYAGTERDYYQNSGSNDNRNDGDGKTRLHYNRQKQQAFSKDLDGGKPKYISRAGVVSDDDDGHQYSQERNATNKEGLASGNPQTKGTHEITGNIGKTTNEQDKDSKNHDDAVGHFLGQDGCVIADRYRILKEVGVGTFGRVVECLDIKRHSTRQNREINDRQYRRRDNDGSHHSHSRYRSPSRRESTERDTNPNDIVAIKIVRNIKRYYDSAKIEADIIEDVNLRGERGVTHCAIMYDTFSFQGHYCMVFECLGPSLYDFLKGQKYHPFPIHCVRDFAKQLLETLEFLHSFRLIHTDLKPENILLLNGRQIPQRGGYSIPESTRIKVIDFGGATYDNEKKSSIVNTRQYRAPEVILGVGWSMPSDMWSIGCILAELYQGELLFATHDNIEHLALIEKIIGRFPRKMLNRAKNVEIVTKAFDSSDSHRMEHVLPTEQLVYVKRTVPLESIILYDEDAWLLRLLRRILVIDPQERATARECLRKF